MSASHENNMASPRPKESKLFAREIAAFSDAELDRYLEEHRLDGLDGPDGGAAEVEVEDPENLPESFIERLRDRAQNASDVVRSKALDLDQLNARLLGVDKNGTPPQAVSRPSHPETRITPPRPPREEVDALLKELETERYKRLVDDGGPPPYPIELLDQVFQNPKAYLTILRPWLEYPDDPPDTVISVFEKVQKRWRDFREWQHANRGLEEDGFQQYVEDRRREKEVGDEWHCRIYGALLPEYNEVETEEEFMRRIQSSWNDDQARRAHQRRRLREHYGIYNGAFAEYVEEAKRRLARNGFTRLFELDEDPRRQDRLTTWIEYLDFEYAWYELYARSVKREQKVHDEEWKKLVDTGVLRPHETQEYLCSDESSYQEQSERVRAQRAVEAAKSAAWSVYTWAQRTKDNPRSSEQERIRKMIAAKAKIDAAEETMKSIKRRNDLISEFVRKGTWNYKSATRNLRRQSFLLQWILEKIEVELNEAQRSNGRPYAGHNTKRRSEGDEIRASGSRRRKQGDGEPAFISNRKSVRDKRVRFEDADDERPSKRSRGGGPGPITRHGTLEISQSSSIPTSEPQVLGPKRGLSNSDEPVELGTDTTHHRRKRQHDPYVVEKLVQQPHMQPNNSKFQSSVGVSASLNGMEEPDRWN